MAELLTRTKAAPRVDLTAMVDLAFLLITFFMLTTSLSKNKMMKVVLPDESVESVGLDVPASRTMTLLLVANDKIAWYIGEAGKAKIQLTDLKTVQAILLNNKQRIEAINPQGKSMLVIVKPTDKSKFRNFVDIMDELNIIELKTAPMIDDEHFTAKELDFIKQN